MGSLIVALLAISVLIVLLETTARTTKLSKVFMRKLTHVSVSLLICVLVPFIGYHLFILLGLLFVGLLYIARRVFPLQVLADHSDKSYGEIFFPLGVAIAAILCQNSSQFITTIAILGLADTAAFIVGRAVSSPKLFHGKTLLGSAAFMIVTFGICLFTLSPMSAIAVATLASICEAVSTRGSDNTTVPVVVALLLVYVVNAY